MVNVLVTSFPGLSLPATLSIPIAASTSISDVVSEIHSRLPAGSGSRLIITTTNNRQLSSQSTAAIGTLLDPAAAGGLLPLRLSAPLCGGKGGFGSQLRAAGGRMSSRKKKKSAEESTGSYRTLDGRRVHTVAYARRLAEQLEARPEADRRERDEKRKRWEAVVESADRRIEELREGGKSKAARLDGKWVEEYDDAVRKTREAVLAAGEEEEGSDASGAGSAGSQDGSNTEEEEGASSGSSRQPVQKAEKAGAAPVKFFGWDDEDEFSEDDEEQDKEEDENMEELGDEDMDTAQVVAEIETKHKGKGKAKAT